MRLATGATIATLMPHWAVADTRHELSACLFANIRAQELAMLCEQYSGKTNKIIDVLYAVEKESCVAERSALVGESQSADGVENEILSELLLVNTVRKEAYRIVQDQHANDGLWPYAFLSADGAVEPGTRPSREEERQAWCDIADREMDGNTPTGHHYRKYRRAIAEAIR